MRRKLLVLLTMVSCAFSCERFTFEKGLGLFSTGSGECATVDTRTWAIGTFESLNMEGFHERSTQFIYPKQPSSCISSPIFEMIPGGIIEVNTFMANHGDPDLIYVIVTDKYWNYGGHVIRWVHDNTRGWRTLQFKILGNSPFNGYINIYGRASAKSTVLIDSIRYLPPGISKSDCLLYEINEDNNNNVTTAGTTIDILDHTTDYTTNEMTDNTAHDTTTDHANTTDGTTFAVTDAVTDSVTDSTNVIPTETTVEDEIEEDISTSPKPIYDDRKDGLIARLKIAIAVGVNVSAEFVAPLVRIN